MRREWLAQQSRIRRREPCPPGTGFLDAETGPPKSLKETTNFRREGHAATAAHGGPPVTRTSAIRHPRTLPPGASRTAFDLIMTRHALVAINAPVDVIDRMLAHPLRQRRLCAFHAFLKRDLRRHIAIGHDLFDATASGGPSKMAKYGNDSHEHYSSPCPGPIKQERCRRVILLWSYCVHFSRT